MVTAMSPQPSRTSPTQLRGRCTGPQPPFVSSALVQTPFTDLRSQRPTQRVRFLVSQVSYNILTIAYYDKTYFLDFEADTLDLGSLDHDKEKCFWNFFHILQKKTYQVQITFCHLYSES